MLPTVPFTSVRSLRNVVFRDTLSMKTVFCSPSTVICTCVTEGSSVRESTSE